MAYTEEELSLLSPEERESITADAPDIDALKAIAGEDDESGGDGLSEAEPAKVKADDTVAEQTVPVAAAPEFTPQIIVPQVEGYDEKIAAFKGQKSELRAKLNSGDIDLDQYEEQKDVVLAQERALELAKRDADNAANHNKQVGEARWLWEQERFFADEANARYKDKYVSAALNAAVIDLASDAANNGKTGEWFLKEADKIVRERFVSAAKPEPDEKKPGASHKPDLRLIPPTLGGLPAAEIAQTGSVDEFAHIDRLQGVAYEEAVARLSPAERERFRASA